MSETKFTPRPWFRYAQDLEEHEGRGPWIYGGKSRVGEPGCKLICTVGNAEHLPPARAEHSANAALIAAAPDLYDALEDLRSSLIVLTKSSDLAEELKQADAALAKARGET